MTATVVVKKEKVKSGILGFVCTKTSLTIQYTNKDVYRYDLSEVLNKAQLKEMVKLAKKGSGLNAYLNKNPEIKKYGYLDTTLSNRSFKAYIKA